MSIRELLLDVRHGLLAVKASVLDEDFVGVPAGNHDSSQVETGHIALEGLRVTGGTVALGINLHSGVPQQIDVRMVARQGKDKVILQANRLTLRVLNANPVLGNLLHFGLEVSLNRSFLDPVLEVRSDPVLDVPAQLGPPVDDRYLGAVPVEVERGDRSRVGSADHRHLTLEKCVAF